MDAVRSSMKMRNRFLFFGAVLLVHGVFAADEVKFVSVMAGDNVTLHTDLTETKGFDHLQWKIPDEDLIIAEIDREDYIPIMQIIPINVSEVLRKNDLKRFSGRLKLDFETGSLTFKGIRTEDSGVYELQVKIRTNVNKYRFNVTVRGGVKTISVMEGETVNLHTGVITIKGYDLILWKKEDDLVFEINKVTNVFLMHDGTEKFMNRLELDMQSGDLAISESESRDSGVYHLHMRSSTHTINRTISVTVKVPDEAAPDPGLSSAAVGGIVAGVLLLVFAAVAGVIYCRCKISKRKGRMDVEKNGTNDPLKAETASSDVL